MNRLATQSDLNRKVASVRADTAAAQAKVNELVSRVAEMRNSLEALRYRAELVQARNELQALKADKVALQ